jgi:hypothetical protein
MFGSRQSPKTRVTAPRQIVTPRLQLLDERDVPTVIAIPDFYTVRAGQTLTVPVNQGVLANDFSSTNPGAILVADLKAGPTLTQPPAAPALPANALVLNANGSFTFTAPSNINPANSPVTFVYQARDITNGETEQTTVTINVTGAATNLYAVGSGPGQVAEVKVFDAASGLQRFDLFPYGGFTGGVRVSTGDINQDGVDDIVTVPDVGGSALVRVFDGKTGSELGAFFAFETDFRGGGYVAVGDVDGDLVKDITVGAGFTGGPRVQVFSLNGGGTLNFTLPPIADYFAYESTFRNGVNVAAGDLDADGLDEIVTGAGPGGGPAVKVYGATELFSGFSTIPARKAFFAFNSNNRGGVNVAVGQFRGDGKADIVTGTGNGAAVVRVFDGRSGAILREFSVTSSDNPVGGTGSGGGLSGAGGNLLPGVGTPNGLSPGATSGSAAVTGGARVAVTDRNSDGLSDIVVGQGIGSPPRVRVFDGNSLVELSNNLIFNSLFTGGVYVGGNSLELG